MFSVHSPLAARQGGTAEGPLRGKVTHVMAPQKQRGKGRAMEKTESPLHFSASLLSLSDPTSQPQACSSAPLLN